MNLEDHTPIDRFVCYLHSRKHVFEKVEVSLFPDFVWFTGLRSDFEYKLKISEIERISYDDWREEMGFRVMLTIMPLLLVATVFVYLQFGNLSLLIVIPIIFLISVKSMKTGELTILKVGQIKLPLIGKKDYLIRFWEKMEELSPIADLRA